MPEIAKMLCMFGIPAGSMTDEVSIVVTEAGGIALQAV